MEPECSPREDAPRERVGAAIGAPFCGPVAVPHRAARGAAAFFAGFAAAGSSACPERPRRGASFFVPAGAGNPSGAPAVAFVAGAVLGAAVVRRFRAVFASAAAGGGVIGWPVRFAPPTRAAGGSAIAAAFRPLGAGTSNAPSLFLTGREIGVALAIAAGAALGEVRRLD